MLWDQEAKKDKTEKPDTIHLANESQHEGEPSTAQNISSMTMMLGGPSKV